MYYFACKKRELAAFAHKPAFFTVWQIYGRQITFFITQSFKNLSHEKSFLTSEKEPEHNFTELKVLLFHLNFKFRPTNRDLKPKNPRLLVDKTTGRRRDTLFNNKLKKVAFLMLFSKRIQNNAC